MTGVTTQAGGCWRLETAPTLAKSTFVDWDLTCEGRWPM